jgi:hypothetical protein
MIVIKVREALQRSRGDIDAAVRLLTRRGEDSSWMSSSDTDWLHHTAGKLPVFAKNRALWKSPVYVRVKSFRRDGENIFFQLHVILDDGRQFERARR